MTYLFDAREVSSAVRLAEPGGVAVDHGIGVRVKVQIGVARHADPVVGVKSAVPTAARLSGNGGAPTCLPVPSRMIT